jgi:cell division protein FtsB
MSSPRFIPACLIALLLVLHAQIWFGRGSLGNVADMERKLDTQRVANLKSQQANERMANEVRDLREGLEMVEEKARLELGMVKPHEVYVQVSGPTAKTAAATTAGVQTR